MVIARSSAIPVYLILAVQSPAAVHGNMSSDAGARPTLPSQRVPEREFRSILTGVGVPGGGGGQGPRRQELVDQIYVAINPEITPRKMTPNVVFLKGSRSTGISLPILAVVRGWPYYCTRCKAPLILFVGGKAPRLPVLVLLICEPNSYLSKRETKI